MNGWVGQPILQVREKVLFGFVFSFSIPAMYANFT